MFNDPIVEEVRRIRDAHAAKFNYDIDAIVADASKRQNERPSHSPFASLGRAAAKKPVVEKA